MELNKQLRALKKLYPEPKGSLRYKKPFQLLVAVILSAQCTDERVNKVTPPLFKQYPTIESFAKANIKALEQAVKPTGYYRNKAKAVKGSAQHIIKHHNKKMPDTIKELTAFPGVGRKTANVVITALHNKAEGIAVDTHVTRISQRLGWTPFKDPRRIEFDLLDKIPKKEWTKITHLLIAHGRKICKAPTPHCSKCPIEKLCPKKGVTKSH